MTSQLRQALNEGRRIICADEAMFTTATLPTKAYAPKGLNVTLDESLVSSPSIAVVAEFHHRGALRHSICKKDQ